MFFGEHEARRTRERLERALSEREQLIFSVAIGEEREHEKRKPIGARLVECAEEARFVRVARSALEQFVGLFATVATEIRMEQIHHRPKMAALFDVDLK